MSGLAEHCGDSQIQAAVKGNLETVKLLLAAGANPDIKNNDGQRPKDLCRNAAVLEYLQPPGPEEPEEEEEKQDDDDEEEVEPDDA